MYLCKRTVLSQLVDSGTLLGPLESCQTPLRTARSFLFTLCHCSLNRHRGEKAHDFRLTLCCEEVKMLTLSVRSVTHCNFSVQASVLYFEIPHHTDRILIDDGLHQISTLHSIMLHWNFIWRHNWNSCVAIHWIFC